MQHRNASTKHGLASHLDRLFSILHATDAKRLAFFDRQRWVQGETLPWQGRGLQQSFLPPELLNHWQHSHCQHPHGQLQIRPACRHPLLKLPVLLQRPL